MSGSTAPYLAGALSLKVQWALVQRFLDEIPLSETHALSKNWISTLEKNILVTALVKKRSELELLRSEAEHAEITSECEIEFPSYDVAFRNSNNEMTGEQISSASEGRNRNALHVDVSRTHKGVEGFPILAHRSLISPLSPTFGPRRGALLTGTVNRRRSIPHSPIHNLRNGNNIETKSLVLRDWEKRVLWESAWIHIEEHLEEYAGRFGVIDEGREKENVWEELVGLRVEGSKLIKGIRSEREDVRG
ncbi:hypothetical protein CC78DRAFT_581621 [Lojkania enalia]|uniref:Uncharacterized protein n=1 Tax=Lojkania enalia TaxID=147567 RepID=A0A9P4N2E5_9PLEO|nr:hypothetical protein CC78DRAFT_581621 [Didymosphaeria enalia]